MLGLWACSGPGPSAGGSAQEGETDIVLSLRDEQGNGIEHATLYRYQRDWQGEKLIDSIACQKVCSLGYSPRMSYALSDGMGRRAAIFELDSGSQIPVVLSAPRALLLVDSLHQHKPYWYGGVGVPDSVARGWIYTQAPVGSSALAFENAWLLHVQMGPGDSLVQIGPVNLRDSVGEDRSMGSPSRILTVEHVQGMAFSIDAVQTSIPVVSSSSTRQSSSSAKALNCNLNMEIWSDSYHFGGAGAFNPVMQRVQAQLQSRRPECQWKLTVLADSLLYGKSAAEALLTPAYAGVNVRAMVLVTDSIPQVKPVSAGGLPVLWVGISAFANPGLEEYDSLWVNRILLYFPQ